jgi:hypothetical protein
VTRSRVRTKDKEIRRQSGWMQAAKQTPIEREGMPKEGKERYDISSKVTRLWALDKSHQACLLETTT